MTFDMRDYANKLLRDMARGQTTAPPTEDATPDEDELDPDELKAIAEGWYDEDAAWDHWYYRPTPKGYRSEEC